MVILTHRIKTRERDGRTRVLDKRMVVYGDTGTSSAEKHVFTGTAKTVGYPVAIGAKMLLDGELSTPGIMLPLTKQFYKPVLELLAKEGLMTTEKTWDEERPQKIDHMNDYRTWGSYSSMLGLS